MRKFEEVKDEAKFFPEVETVLPTRADRYSAGYDFYSKEDYILKPGEFHMFHFDVKASMFYDNVLFIFPRSGLGCKLGVVCRNNVGVIDASYYNNETNDGNISACLVNNGEDEVHIHVGDRIAQGVFTRYLITDDDKFLVNKDSDIKRTGGIGSTGL